MNESRTRTFSAEGFRCEQNRVIALGSSSNDPVQVEASNVQWDRNSKATSMDNRKKSLHVPAIHVVQEGEVKRIDILQFDQSTSSAGG